MRAWQSCDRCVISPHLVLQKITQLVPGNGAGAWGCGATGLDQARLTESKPVGGREDLTHSQPPRPPHPPPEIQQIP